MTYAKALLAGVLSAALVITAPAPARAEMIGTAQLLSADARAGQEAQVRDFLARDDVRKQLEAMGVDANAAQERVASLTDAELQQLDQEIAKAPAAGDGIFIVLGVVFFVLIILELVGVLHIFRH